MRRVKNVPAVSHGISMIFMASMGKVHAGDIHTSIDHLDKIVRGLGHRSNGTDNAGQPYPGSPAEDVQTTQVVHGCGLALSQPLLCWDITLGQNGLKDKQSDLLKSFYRKMSTFL